MPNISLTKKFTRDSLKRANMATNQGSLMEEKNNINNNTNDLNKAQVIQTEMARARAKSLRTTNALHRTANRVAATAQQQQQQQRTLSPYRSFGLHTTGVTPLSVHAATNRDDTSTTNHNYNAEILTSMSSLTEPTWGAPSMSMDITSTFGGGNSTHQRRTSNNAYNPSRLQETVVEDDDNEDVATISTTDSKYKKMVGEYSRQRKEAATKDSNLVTTNSTEARDPPPPATRTTENEATDVSPKTPRRSSSTRRKKTKDSGSSSKRRSSSTSSRRSTFSVPVDPRQFESTFTSGKRSSHRSKSRKERSSRSSSVPPESQHSRNHHHSSSSSFSSNHDEQVAAAMAKFRMYEESQKIRNGDANNKNKNTNGASIVATPTDEKSREANRSSDGTEEWRDAILSTSSTHEQSEVSAPASNYQQLQQQQQQQVVVATTPPGTTPHEPKSVVEAARLSLRPTIRRTNSNRSHTSNHSECFSMASSARMLSSSNSSVSPYLVHPKEATTDTNNVSVSAAATVTSPPAMQTGLSRRSLAGTASRTQKMLSDARARAIHKEKSKLWQSLNNNNTNNNNNKEPLTGVSPSNTNNNVPLAAVPSTQQQQEERQSHSLSQQPFDERSSLFRSNPSRVDQRRRRSPSNSSSYLGSSGTPLLGRLFGWLIWILRVVVWCVPKFLFRLVYPGRRWEARHKSIVITGALSAMGSEIARQYAMEGAKLALIAHCPSSSSSSLLYELQNDCRELGACQVHVYAADMTNPLTAELTIRQAGKDLGRQLDVVIIHGPTYRQGCYFEEITNRDHIGTLLKENALGGMLTLQCALPYMPKTNQSRIVVISSGTAGRLGAPYQSVFAASQHALTGFCDSLRMELTQSYRGRAPKVCLVSFGELAGVGVGTEDVLLDMGATLPPSKTHPWSGIPLQHAVHDLLQAVAKGNCREFGTPTFVNRWRCLSVLAPSVVDWCIQRHVESSQYRPSAGDEEGGGRSRRSMNRFTLQHQHQQGVGGGLRNRYSSSSSTTCTSSCGGGGGGEGVMMNGGGNTNAPSKSWT
ncbi:short chain dehydrogenase [Nitzschia inconspicua]|uniref:Short chain dehydrogenase n=1 Tax=Nitzschia inconspicua TaxID=303405 RepID=A0A9K3M258_9STRA|nr:short chain dehydrogenase [Nitzschia inconspicua]